VDSEYGQLEDEQKQTYHRAYSQLRRDEQEGVTASIDPSTEYATPTTIPNERAIPPSRLPMTLRSFVPEKRSTCGRPPLGEAPMSLEEQVLRQSQLDEMRRREAKTKKVRSIAARKRWHPKEDVACVEGSDAGCEGAFNGICDEVGVAPNVEGGDGDTAGGCHD
jgi:hypothetical protein